MKSHSLRTPKETAPYIRVRSAPPFSPPSAVSLPSSAPIALALLHYLTDRQLWGEMIAVIGSAEMAPLSIIWGDA